MTFNGFISYSHAADNRLAPAIQRGLHRLAKPWHRRRALWIFRDQTGLAVTPTLWTSIRDALDGSDFFVLLASPEAARSPWVNREIQHWTATKSATKILPVVTDGTWRWDPRTRDFSDDSTAVPAALRGAFTEEPLYLDLRWARDDQHLSLRHSRFRDAIAQLAAPMHGVSKDDLEGEDVRQHRRARRLRSGALATLVLLTFVAVLTGLTAMRNAERANAAAHEAQRQEKSAAEQRTSAAQSAGEARRQQDVAHQEQTRAEQATAETQRQLTLAREQKALAAQASVEADKQQRLAENQKALAAQATADARNQQKNAKQQRELAAQATVRAQQQEKLARQQRDLATRWAAEAEREQQLAHQAAQDAAAQQAKAAQQTRIAVGRRLINQAKATIGDDPQTALMLGAAADKIQNDVESRRELTGITTSTRYAGTIAGAESATFGAGNIVATYDEDNVVSLWNVADRAHPVKLSTLTDKAYYMGFSPDGRLLAVAGSSRPAILWNVADPAHPVRIGPVPDLDFVNALRFSPDGRTLAASVFGMGVPPDGPAFIVDVRLFDVSDPARVTRVSTVTLDDPADQIEFSPDSRTMVLTTLDRLSFWNVTDRTHPVHVDDQDHSIEQPIAYSSNQSLLATAEGDDGTVVLWNTGDPHRPVKAGTLKLGRTVTSLAFRPMSTILATGDAGGTTTLWDVSVASAPMRLGPATGDDAVAGMTYSRDGRTLITDGVESVTLWNTIDYGTPERVAAVGNASSSTRASVYDSTGRSLTTVRSDGNAYVWDVRRPAHPVLSATVPVGGRALAAISADRRTIVAGGGQQMTVTDVSDPNHPATAATVPVFTSSGHLADTFGTMALSPDGHLLIITTQYGSLLEYDLTDRSDPHVIYRKPAGTAGSYNEVAFSPDGRTLAVNDRNGKLWLWDMTDPAAPADITTLISRRTRNGDDRLGVSFSADGHTLVAGGFTKNAALMWDVTDRAHPVRLAPLNHAGTVESAAFSPDGHLVATQSDDHTMILWDITDRNSPTRITVVHDGATGHVEAVSPDGHTLLTTGTIWDYSGLNTVRTDPERQACTMAGRGLTREEWTRYIPEVRYERTCTR